MSIHLKIVVFYGIKLQANFDEDKIDRLIEDVENDEKDVEIIDIDPMGNGSLFLAALDSIHDTPYDDPQMCVSIGNEDRLNSTWDNHIKNACEKYQLDYSRPRWFFASYYS